MSVRRRPLAGSTALTDAAVCSFWYGLTLSPWRLSVVRGTQLPQRVGAHVLGRNSGTHGWLRWSVTNKLIPVRPGWRGDIGRVTRKNSAKARWGGGVVECKSGLDGRQTSGRGCSDGRRRLLVLIRPYTEPVTPLGRQRDSAAAASRGPCSRTEQRDPRLAEVERHQQTDSSKFSCPAWTPLSSSGSCPGKGPVKCSQHLVASLWEPQR